MTLIKKLRAWEKLIADGLVASRADAERWILMRKVHCGDAQVTSAGQLLPTDAQVTIQGLNDKYTSKGGYKLEGALAAFSALFVAGRVAIDAGASTGGFTDCLVKHGCARVYAVDVGYGQLHGSLRNHSAVVNLERTNISDAPLLALDPVPDLGTVDLSYLSLRKGVPIFAEILHHRGDLICLVKPLFEIDDAQARREGVVPDDAYAPMLADLCRDFCAQGMAVRGIAPSPVTGNTGTIEFFLWLALDGLDGLSTEAETQQIDAAVSAALALERYKK